jgi:heme exporter protein B
MLALMWKDLLLESRSRETVLSLFVLGVTILLVFNFALDVVPANVSRLAPGLLWIAIIFSAMLGLGRTFLIERENACMAGLLMAPLDRGALFIAKLAVNFLLIITFELLLLPVFVLLFDLELGGRMIALAAVLAGGTLGLAAVGTLFALAALGTRARELMLPILVLPLQIPLLIAAVKATSLVMAGAAVTELGPWGHLMAAFDILFVTVGWLAFEFVSVD